MEFSASSAPASRSLRPLRRLSDRATSLPRWTRYFIAVSGAAISVLLRFAFDPAWDARLPYITFFPAIMLSAWLGGFGPGLVTTALCAFSGAYLWLPPLRSFGISAPGDWLGLGVFVFVGVVISALNEAWRRGTAALAESERRLTVTLASIGDAVLTTDDNGRITGMNGVASSLTGWIPADAIGKRLGDVLVIVREDSSQLAPNPVREALRDGGGAGLADRTVLVSRDGRRIPIDDSAAPIRLEDGRAAGAIMVFRDITERRRNEAERETQDRAARELAAIVESSDDAIVSKDLESTIKSWNRGAERIFGYTAEEMVGRSIRVIIPEDRWGEEDEVLRQLRRGEKVDHFETVRQTKDGREVPVSLTISPVYSPGGVVVGASKIARDISDRKQVEAERAQMLVREQEARAEFERAGRLKDDFLAMLSHELRTPLNAVLGYAQLLLAGVVPPKEIPQAVQAIQRNAQAQARLVESLLDMSRVLAGKLELNLKNVTLSTVIEAAVDAVRPDAVRKHIVLEISDSSNLARVTGDASRLQQVFWNVLSNAMKFTAEGGRVTVVVTTDGPKAQIRITDNGRGIAPDFLPHVFDRFKQGKGEGSREQAGLGLGLSLVRELVHAHGGTVSAESEGEGRGAAFTVRLPVAPSTAADPLVPPESNETPDLLFGASQAEALIADAEQNDSRSAD